MTNEKRIIVDILLLAMALAAFAIAAWLALKVLLVLLAIVTFASVCFIYGYSACKEKMTARDER
ncbi:hypothetical protein NE261_00540 [Enterococcus italicus]|uniref:hypothetical protein n=1 Tax=Enterococcus italicus TaxID=246144 RepID=UPI002073E950|nr:hypothetical protein [Enterococcus italicus]MCM6930306.1 hypothetical protein [Enterococcus italicus]